MKSKPFIIIYIVSYIASISGIFLGIVFKNYGLTKINDDYFISLIGALYLVFYSVSSLFWGFLADIVNFKKSF